MADRGRAAVAPPSPPQHHQIVGDALLDGVDTPGYVTLLVAVTALAGVQMVMLGVIGEYVGRSITR